MTSQFRQGSCATKLSATEQQTANKIMAKREGVAIVSKILAAVAPYVKNKDPKTRMAVSKKVTANILKALATKKPINQNTQVVKMVNEQANHLLNSIDSTFAQTQRTNNYSYTPSDAAPNAKNTKIPPASSYGTYLECTEDLDTNYNVDPKISAEYCKAVNADAGQSGPSNIQGGIKKNISAIANQPLRQKSASIVETYPWAVAIGAIDSPNETVTIDNGLRSASKLPAHYFPDAEYAMHRRRDAIESIKERRNQKAIKSASEGIDTVHYAYAMDYL